MLVIEVFGVVFLSNEHFPAFLVPAPSFFPARSSFGHSRIFRILKCTESVAGALSVDSGKNIFLDVVGSHREDEISAESVGLVWVDIHFRGLDRVISGSGVPRVGRIRTRFEVFLGVRWDVVGLVWQEEHVLHARRSPT